MLRIAPHFFLALGVLGSLAAAASPQLVERAASPDATLREAAIAELRALGPEGLNLLAAAQTALKAELAAKAGQQAPPQDATASVVEKLTRLESAMDDVAGQRYGCRSRLFWYTDLEKAKAAATKQNKPILSLRMLGKLNEDFSCANSRFFRTTLYANSEVSELLREKFILHWQSVRPVPRVTIDFGDGRKLERTLTGNSIHYVLLSNGQMVDALPGLYGPSAFLSQLNTSLQLIEQLASVDDVARHERLTMFHQLQLTRLEKNWADDFAAASRLLNNPSATPGQSSPPPIPQAQQQPVSADPPDAARAVRIAVPKMRIERSLVRAAIPAESINPVNVTDDRLWQIIAELHQAEAKLDSASLQLIRSQNPIAAHAARLAITKRVVEDPLVKLVRTLEGSIAVDTVRNEYQLHRQLHQWLIADASPNIDQFNERVYAQLFLTPSSDPWLGLAPVDTYTALPNGGVAPQQ